MLRVTGAQRLSPQLSGTAKAIAMPNLVFSSSGWFHAVFRSFDANGVTTKTRKTRKFVGRFTKPRGLAQALLYLSRTRSCTDARQ
jgi:hypothetical protein